MRIPFTNLQINFSKRTGMANPQQWLIDFFGGGEKTSSGVNITEYNAMKYTAFYAAVRVLSETLGSLPLILYRKTQDGKGKERATDHPLYKILHDRPNPEMTAMVFRETLMSHLLTWGNCYAQIVRNNGFEVAQLWPLRPDRMFPKRSGGELIYEFHKPGGGIKIFQSGDILHIPGLSFDGLVGYSPVQMAKEALGLGKATEQFGSNYFGNGANPGGVLEHPGTLSDTAFQHLQDSWSQRHQGLENAHRPAILEEGTKWTSIGIPPEDSQFLETRKFQIEEIARIFRLPPHMIGDLEHATFSNIEQQSLDFVTYSLHPWLERWEQAIEHKLLLPNEQENYYVEHLVDGLLRGDIKARYTAYNIGRNGGWLSVNDIRLKENMDPIEDGDQYLMPLNMVPVGTEPDPNDPNDPQDDKKKQTKRSFINKEERALRFATSRRGTIDSFKHVFVDAAGRVVRSEEREVMKKAKKSLLSRDLSDFEEWLDKFYEDHRDFIISTMRPAFQSITDAVRNQAQEEIKSTGDLGSDVENFLKDYIETFADRYISSSKGQIREVVTDSVKNGSDPVADLQKRFDSWRDKRPDKVANNETNRVGNAVAKTVFLLSGILRLKWRTIGENCAYCNHLDGKVVGIRDFFVTKGESIQPEGADTPLKSYSNIGHPPIHEGCDCVISPE